MTIYIDEVLVLNFFFDFLILLTVSLILKRNTKIINILYGSIIGSLSIFLLFLDISIYLSILYKISISIMIIYTTFGFKNFNYFIKNIIYFYFVSVFLGGGLYLLNNSLNYHNGIVFYNKSNLNLLVIILMTPILLYIYIKRLREIKNNYNNYYNITFFIKDVSFKVVSYLDTANKLVSPVSSKPVILLHNKNPVFDNLRYTLIPYNTINGNGLLKCYKVDIYIEGVGFKKKVLVGLIDSINIDGVDCILNTKLLEEI